MVGRDSGRPRSGWGEGGPRGHYPLLRTPAAARHVRAAHRLLRALGGGVAEIFAKESHRGWGEALQKK